MAWIGSAAAAVGSVFSFIGSRGNASSSLILANFHAITALHENLGAINVGLQSILATNMEMYQRLNAKINEANVQQIDSLHRGYIRNVLDDIQKYSVDGDLSLTARISSAEELYNSSIGNVNDIFAHRNAFLDFAAQSSTYVLTPSACYSARVEIEILNFLILLGIDVGRSKFTLSDIGIVCERYLSFFRNSMNPDVDGSITNALEHSNEKLTATIDQWNLLNYSDDTENRLPLEKGTYQVGATPITEAPIIGVNLSTKDGGLSGPTEDFSRYIGVTYSYEILLLTVDESNIGTASIPVSSYNFSISRQSVSKKIHYASNDFQNEKDTFFRGYKAIVDPANNIGNFGPDEIFENLQQAIDRYQNDVLPAITQAYLDVAQWQAIRDSVVATIDYLECTKQIALELDATCAEKVEEKGIEWQR